MCLVDISKTNIRGGRVKNNRLGVIVEEIKYLDLDELIEIKEVVDGMIDSIKEQKQIVIELEYNQFKGSGKCWIARVDSKTKRTLSFVDVESNQRDGNTKGFKTFILKDGYYLSCETGTKSYDNREYFKVKDGQVIDF